MIPKRQQQREQTPKSVKDINVLRRRKMHKYEPDQNF